MITAAEIERRFTYHKPDEAGRASMDVLRGDVRKLAQRIVKDCPPCRETSLAITKLEEAAMWAIAARARPPVGT